MGIEYNSDYTIFRVDNLDNRWPIEKVQIGPAMNRKHDMCRLAFDVCHNKVDVYIFLCDKFPRCIQTGRKVFL